MTDSLERISQRLHSVSELSEIVGAMRAMAAVRLQEAQAALEGTRDYADTVAGALEEAMALAPPEPVPQSVAPALVVFFPEHGFVGSLTERLVARAREAACTGLIIALGDRGADVAEQNGMALHARLPLGAHVNASPTVARRLTAILDTAMAAGRADGVDILFAHCLGAGREELVLKRLLPVTGLGTKVAAGPEPLINLPRPALVEAVITEWFLGELVHAVVETLASENGARLRAMDAARRNVDARLDDLQGTYRVARQEAITEEIAEVVAGVLAQE